MRILEISQVQPIFGNAHCDKGLLSKVHAFKFIFNICSYLSTPVHLSVRERDSFMISCSPALSRNCCLQRPCPRFAAIVLPKWKWMCHGRLDAVRASLWHGIKPCRDIIVLHMFNANLISNRQICRQISKQVGLYETSRRIIWHCSRIISRCLALTGLWHLILKLHTSFVTCQALRATFVNFWTFELIPF